MGLPYLHNTLCYKCDAGGLPNQNSKFALKLKETEP
jgi:hypothetical protein